MGVRGLGALRSSARLESVSQGVAQVSNDVASRDDPRTRPIDVLLIKRLRP